MDFKALVLILFLLSGPESLAGTPQLTMNIIRSEPVGYMAAAGQLTGYHVDFFRRLEDLLGEPMHLQLLPFPRGLQGLKIGKLDGGLLFRVAKRESFLQPVVFVYNTHVAAVGHKGIKIRTLDDLRGKSVGIVRGVAVTPEFDAAVKTFGGVVRINNYPQLVKMGARGRVDVIVGNFYSFWRLADKLKVRDKLELPGMLLVNQEVWFHMSKKSSQIRRVPELRNGIRKILDSGFIDTLFLKYYGINPGMAAEKFRQSKPKTAPP